MMKFHRFFVSLILAFVAVALCGSGALAAPALEANHVSRVLLNDSFKPDYGTAGFLWTWLSVYDAPTGLSGELILDDVTYPIEEIDDRGTNTMRRLTKMVRHLRAT